MNTNYTEIKLQNTSYTIMGFTLHSQIFIVCLIDTVHDCCLERALKTLNPMEVLSKGEPADGSSFIYLAAALAADNLTHRRGDNLTHQRGAQSGRYLDEQGGIPGSNLNPEELGGFQL